MKQFNDAVASMRNSILTQILDSFGREDTQSIEMKCNFRTHQCIIAYFNFMERFESASMA